MVYYILVSDKWRGPMGWTDNPQPVVGVKKLIECLQSYEANYPGGHPLITTNYF